MKKQLGQFFTTNSDYILQGFDSFVKNKIVIDPFAGNQDLILWAKSNGCKKVTGFDCDKKYIDNKIVFQNDSINSIKKYKFICTNPPYLHKNKADKKTKKDFFSGINSEFEDLYQVSINSILNSEEGILIVPLNFLSAENSQKIRNIFFEKFNMIKLNIFSEQVFEDTTYNVISFYFKKRKKNIENNKISTTIFPENKKLTFSLNKNTGWQLGGEFLRKIETTKNYLGVFRLTEDFLESGNNKVRMAVQNIKDVRDFNISNELKEKLEKNILILRAIDSKNGKKIQLEDIREYRIFGLVGKNTSRNIAHIIFKKEVSVKEQKNLIKKFNTELNENREKYLSFFLTNFRDNNRKRISFDFAYKLLNYVYKENYARQSTLF